MTKNNFTVKYTNKDIMDRLDELKTEVTKLSEHVSTQNGRVGKLERGSMIFEEKYDRRFNLIYKTFGATLLTVLGWIIWILIENAK